MIRQPHILCTKEAIGKVVLLPGDPARAKLIGEKYLDKGKFIAQYREFLTYTGFYRGVRVSVTSTGVGSPSAAIAVEELINLGAKVLIRVGTCGGALKDYIKVGSIIIPTASIREEGTTKEYLPEEFPAVADYRVVAALEANAQEQGFPYYVGVNRTHDAFYGQAKNIKSWGSIYLDQRMKTWNYPLLSSEMECAPVFLISLIRGIMAGAVLAVNYTPEPLEKIVKGNQKFSTPGTHLITKEAKASVDRAIKTALGAVEKLKNML